MLTPNATYKMNGVTVHEKIIPDGTRWKDDAKAKAAAFTPGHLYKPERPISGTGKPQSVTIHNTADLAGVYDDAEQYTRATYNENMGAARVQFYVDDVGAWQNLRAGTGLCSADPEGSAEVGLHAGDEYVLDGGNWTSLSIEIIMGETAQTDAIAKDNGARIAAWLLWKHNLGIDKLVSHTYWVNKKAGKTFADVDEQCTNPISGLKWCPTYIFASNDRNVALKNWKAFKATVKKYLDTLNGVKDTTEKTETPTPSTSNSTGAQKFNVGDIVKFAGGIHYGHANAESGSAVGACKAKITQYCSYGKHKYHCRAVNDAGAFVGGVYGWVDESTLSAIDGDKTESKEPTPNKPADPAPSTPTVSSVEERDLVNIAVGSVYYGTTTKVPSWVTDQRWYVTQVVGDRVVVGANEKGTSNINSAINAKYLTVANKSTPPATSTTPSAPALKSIDEIAREVIRGEWGNDPVRGQKITAAGYDYAAVRKRVNELYYN